jgi:hypothetical protein
VLDRLVTGVIGENFAVEYYRLDDAAALAPGERLVI